MACREHDERTLAAVSVAVSVRERASATMVTPKAVANMMARHAPGSSSFASVLRKEALR